MYYFKGFDHIEKLGEYKWKLFWKIDIINLVKNKIYALIKGKKILHIYKQNHLITWENILTYYKYIHFMHFIYIIYMNSYPKNMKIICEDLYRRRRQS